jgi:hypothetical protein
MYRTYLHEEKTVNGFRVTVNELRWVDGERTYEVIRADTGQVLPGAGDFRKPPSDEEIARFLGDASNERERS